MVAILFHRLGPYHVARLRAASEFGPVVVIELSSETKEYAWAKVEGDEPFKRVTLFQGSDSHCAPARELASRLEQLLTKLAPKTVAVPGWWDHGSLAALRWCGENAVPVVVMSESTENDEPRLWWKELIKRQVVNMCGAALVGGNPHANYIAKLGISRDRIFLGYDTVDNDYFSNGAKEIRSGASLVREQCGLPENYFLASARFIEKKNLPRLIQAYSRYRELVSMTERRTRTMGSIAPEPGEGAWDLVLLGDGSLRSSILDLRSFLSLDTCVHLPGFKQYPDLPAYYGLANAFIHASTTEQWGLVVNEAMASGLPVVVSNRCGCAKDLVHDGVNGFIFDPYNVEQLAQLMWKVSAFNFPLAEFGEASREIISEWGAERFAQGLRGALRKTLEVGPKRFSTIQRALLGILIHR